MSAVGLCAWPRSFFNIYFMHLIFITLLKYLRWLPHRTDVLVYYKLHIFPFQLFVLSFYLYIFTIRTGNRANVSCHHLAVVVCIYMMQELITRSERVCNRQWAEYSISSSYTIHKRVYYNYYSITIMNTISLLLKVILKD